MIPEKDLEQILRDCAKHGHTLKQDEVGVWFKRDEVLRIVEEVSKKVFEITKNKCLDQSDLCSCCFSEEEIDIGEFIYDEINKNVTY